MSAKNIKSLMIPCVEMQYTQEYIANVFWQQQIGKVSKVTIIPYAQNSEMYNIVYIKIEQWCDNESAYNFIKKLKNENGETRIFHHNDDWWPVQLNTHNNGDICVGTYTMTFDSSYFMKDELLPLTAECSDEEDEEDEYEIKGLYDEYYSIAGAVKHIDDLTESSFRAIAKGDRELLNMIQMELNHLQHELLIDDAVKKSKNVTTRQSTLKKNLSNLFKNSCDEMYA